MCWGDCLLHDIMVGWEQAKLQCVEEGVKYLTSMLGGKK